MSAQNVNAGCSIENRIERMDSENRELAVTLAKLATSIDHLDERIDKADQSLTGIAEFARKWDQIFQKMSSVETMLIAAQEADRRITATTEKLDKRVDALEGKAKSLTVAIRWVVAMIGALALQFSERVIDWALHGGGNPQ
jgi:prefoldin subunit 5